MEVNQCGIASLRRTVKRLKNGRPSLARSKAIEKLPLHARMESAVDAPETFDKKAYKRYSLAKKHQRIRAKVFQVLGSECARCGWNKDLRALQIDHKNKGGRAHYKKRSTAGVATDAIRNPKDFQILCANCNWLKRYDNNEVRKTKDVDQYSKDRYEYFQKIFKRGIR